MRDSRWQEPAAKGFFEKLNTLTIKLSDIETTSTWEILRIISTFFTTRNINTVGDMDEDKLTPTKRSRQTPEKSTGTEMSDILLSIDDKLWILGEH